jgi:predicted dienelactone hydrolase
LATVLALTVLALTALLAACGGDGTATTTATTTAPPTTVAPATTTTAATTTTTTLPPPTAADGAALGQSGPFGVGEREYEVTDPARQGRTYTLVVYYPALTDAVRPDWQAEPNRAGAPYPVAVSGDDTGKRFGPHLASHGFVWASAKDHYSDITGWNTWVLDFPLDHLRNLDFLAELADDPLADMADTSRAGIFDYSYGGLVALTMSGARLDPDAYLATCESAPVEPPADFTSPDPDWQWDVMADYMCATARNWEEFPQYAAEVGVATTDGLWNPVTDDRIKAVVLGAPEGKWLFGDAGLAAADRPALIIVGSLDGLYTFEDLYLWEHLGGPTDLITFVGADHYFPFAEGGASQVKRFVLAFLGLHLQGVAEYAQYLTKEFVEQVAPGLSPNDSYSDIVWGAYEG